MRISETSVPDQKRHTELRVHSGTLTTWERTATTRATAPQTRCARHRRGVFHRRPRASFKHVLDAHWRAAQRTSEGNCPRNPRTASPRLLIEAARCSSALTPTREFQARAYCAARASRGVGRSRRRERDAYLWVPTSVDAVWQDLSCAGQPEGSNFQIPTYEARGPRSLSR
jgi:hypothetical protein